ncbi:phage tail protein [Chromobacterium vaccinii]|nr:phage tail protein [Chromobacterium vaccinii]
MFALWIEADLRFEFSESDNGGLKISDSAYAALIAGHNAGKEIRRDGKGAPLLFDPPAPSYETLAAAVRADRDVRLFATQWFVERHTDQISVGDKTSLTVEQYTTLLKYRQSLRDVPAQSGFPLSVLWPPVPDYISKSNSLP